MKKKIIVFLFLFVVICGQFLYSQPLKRLEKDFSIFDQEVALFTLDGTWWRKISDEAKVTYIIGFLTALHNVVIINDSLISLIRNHPDYLRYRNAFNFSLELLKKYSETIRNKYFVHDIVDYVNDYYAGWPIKNDPIIKVLNDLILAK